MKKDNRPITFITIRDKRTGRKRVIPIFSPVSTKSKVSKGSSKESARPKRDDEKKISGPPGTRKDLERDLVNWAKETPFVKQMCAKYGVDLDRILRDVVVRIEYSPDLSYEVPDAHFDESSGEMEFIIGPNITYRSLRRTFVHELAHYIYTLPTRFRRESQFLERRREIIVQEGLPWYQRTSEQFAMAWEILYLKSLGLSEEQIKEDFRVLQKFEREFNTDKFVEDVLKGKYDWLVERG
jgi:hypothetical protein